MMKLLILIVATCAVGALCAEEKCEPGTTFMEDCNRCRCGPEGQKSCTRKMCPPNELSDDSQVRTDVQNGESLSSTDEKDLLHVPTNGQVCSPNEIKMKDCNRCRCANNGIGWFCTRRACPAREKRSSPNTEEKCTPGTTFRSSDGCNTCFCTDTGIAACTLKACFTNFPERIPLAALTEAAAQRVKRSRSNENCTPGTVFKSDDGCNTCFCTDDGHAACTLMACLPSEPQQKQKRDTLPQSDIAPGAPGFSCEPKSSFKYQCNTCLCSDDGKMAGCTFKYCIPGEW
ncbi:pacifastin-like protease inhibitor cvp4 [Anopheles stephensi]|uniref:pacifastin-like protease inhibitor cvp4 n=1 Tax=Anopheles stephensi TaxID=30069 RepID=UPI0007D65999|nr:pacifastin-like protease inhibitor cvp4 [Anopheles stephensi]